MVEPWGRREQWRRRYWRRSRRTWRRWWHRSPTGRSSAEWSVFQRWAARPPLRTVLRGCVPECPPQSRTCRRSLSAGCRWETRKCPTVLFVYLFIYLFGSHKVRGTKIHIGRLDTYMCQLRGMCLVFILIICRIFYYLTDIYWAT